MMLDTSTQLMVDITPAKHIDGGGKKQRRMKQRKKQQAVPVVSDTSSMSSTEMPKRKKNPKKKKNKQQKKNPHRPQQREETTEDEKARYVALDCEMVGVGEGGFRSSLARVCIVNWDGEKLLDVYVRQNETVTDYRTFVSGITEDLLESEDSLSFEECRRQVLDILSGKILVGHALKSDIRALRISHPWYDTRDTGKYEPFMKVRFNDGILWPRKLKDLAKEKLGRDIQQMGIAHCPQEDASTAMDLYKLVRRKWEKAMAYKYNKTLEIENLKKRQLQQQ